MKDSEVLARAAEILDERGWCQYKGQNAAGNVCIGEAVSTALREAGAGSVRRVLALGAVYGRGMPALIQPGVVVTQADTFAAFNDRSGITVEDVKLRLKECISELEERGE